MNDDNEPNLVTSSKSRRVMIGSHTFSVEIFKFEGDLEWILEVVDETAPAMFGMTSSPPTKKPLRSPWLT